MYKNIKYFAVLSIILIIEIYNQDILGNEPFYYQKIKRTFPID